MSEAPDLSLRARPPTVMRLSRRTLLIATASMAVATAGAAAFGLSHKRSPGQTDPQPVLTGAPPEALRRLPADYAGPRLGPPLPGDLGRPMLAAEGEGASPSASAHPDAPPAAADQAQEAWRRSDLFLAQARPSPARPADKPAATPVATPVPDYLLRAGATIPAALITAVQSDLPGQVLAQVTRPVHDSATGAVVLIPQGARLLGRYDSKASFGQRRLSVVWTRLVLPDGRSHDLRDFPAGDQQGRAGLADRVDRHWTQLFAMAGLSTLLAVGAELGADDDGDIVQALRRGVVDTANSAGQQAVGLGVGAAPTMTVRAGTPVSVILTEDLRLQAFEEETS